MTSASEISFYILAETVPKACDLYTCRIVEKAYSRGHSVYIHTVSLEETQNFDIQLWTFRDTSFIPHEIYNQNSSSEALILIGYDTVPTQKNDVLINLTPEIPSFYQQFNKVIEIIPNNDELKALARKKYLTYQQLGLQIAIFNIKA